jgi:hypothetical protein
MELFDTLLYFCISVPLTNKLTHSLTHSMKQSPSWGEFVPLLSTPPSLHQMCKVNRSVLGNCNGLLIAWLNKTETFEIGELQPIDMIKRNETAFKLTAVMWVWLVKLHSERDLTNIEPCLMFDVWCRVATWCIVNRKEGLPVLGSSNFHVSQVIV